MGGSDVGNDVDGNDVGNDEGDGGATAVPQAANIIIAKGSRIRGIIR